MKKLISALTCALSAALLAGCVSGSAGRDEAERILAERARISRAPDDAATARARAQILARPLTADASARLAVLAHPQVDAAFADLGVARADLVSAVTLPNPELEGTVRFIDGGQEYDLGASIDVTRLLSLASRKGAAEEALDASAVEAAGVAMDVGLEAERAFYALVAAEQILTMRRTSAFALAQSADLARRLFEAGNVTPLVPAQQLAMFEESRVLVARAEVEVEAARERMIAALGLVGADAEKLQVPAKLDDAPARDEAAADLERVALEQSLDLRALRARHAAAAGRADVAKWGFVPGLKAGISAEHADDSWGVGPQVGVELPIFDHGQGEGAAADAQMGAARARMRAAGLQIRASARTLAARLATAREQAAFYQGTLLPLRRRVVQESELQYNAMNTSAFQLLAAKRDEIETTRAYVETLRDYWTLRAEVEQLRRGRLVSSQVSAPSAVGSGGGAADVH